MRLIFTLFALFNASQAQAKSYIYFQSGMANNQETTVFSSCDSDHDRAKEWHERVKALNIFDRAPTPDSKSFENQSVCVTFLFDALGKYNPEVIKSITFKGKYTRRGRAVSTPISTYRTATIFLDKK